MYSLHGRALSLASVFLGNDCAAICIGLEMAMARLRGLLIYCTRCLIFTQNVCVYVLRLRMPLRACVCACVCMCVYVCVYTHVNVCVYTHVNVCARVIYMCVCASFHLSIIACV